MLRTMQRPKTKATGQLNAAESATPSKMYPVRTEISKDAEQHLLDEQRRRYEANGFTKKPALMAIAAELLEGALLALHQKNAA
jgi:hypothetical protein